MNKYDKIRLQIRNGENEFTEFKSRLVDERNIGRIISAFANNKGGTIFFGVSDKGEIIGLTETDINLSFERLSKIIASILPVPSEIEKFQIENKEILICQIPSLPDHLKPIRTSTGEVYKRVGESSQLVKEIEELKSGAAIKKKVKGFVAMSFRNEEEPALVDYYNAMIRAVEATKLPIELYRIDLNDGDFEISQQIMTDIDSSNFLICDFTLSPHNVYFEVGYARGKGKRIIQTARKDTQLQFDIRNWTTLFYRNATELEKGLISKITDAYNQIVGK